MSVPNFIKPYVNIITKTKSFRKVRFIKITSSVLAEFTSLISFITSHRARLQFSLTTLSNHIQHQEIFSDNSSTFLRSEESGVILTVKTVCLNHSTLVLTHNSLSTSLRNFTSVLNLWSIAFTIFRC